ncbi:anti-sigma-D factor RsdA [Mycolicibacterium sp. XJ1904]
MPDFGRWTSNGGDPSLNEINRTDRFLDALATAQPVYSTDPSEADLAQLLEGWRDEVRNAPLTATVTPRDAVLALDRAAASRRRTRTSLAVVGSAAAAVLCIGGFGAVVAGSGPGDSLYGLRTMLFGEQQDTRDDAVVLAAQTQLAEVQQLIDDGQWQAAQDKLETLTTTVATVDDTVRKEELVTQWQELTVKVEAQDPAATLPPNAPPPTFPEVVVIPSDGATSSEATGPSGTSAPTSTSETSPPTTPSTSEPTTPSTSPAPSPSPSTTAVPGAPLPTSAPGTPLPTVSATPQPTSAPNSPTALPTPTAQPTPSATPRPTPTADTPIPSPSTRVQVPTPTSLPSVVEQQEDEVPTAAPTSQQPTVQAPAPRTAATTVTVPDAVEEPS